MKGSAFTCRLLHSAVGCSVMLWRGGHFKLQGCDREGERELEQDQIERECLEQDRSERHKIVPVSIYLLCWSYLAAGSGEVGGAGQKN